MPVSKKSLQCREKFFFCADDLFCQMFDPFVGSRILVQVAVQGFDAHIAPIGDQACDGTVRIVTHGNGKIFLAAVQRGYSVILPKYEPPGFVKGGLHGKLVMLKG